jgi:hypothetical protein
MLNNEIKKVKQKKNKKRGCQPTLTFQTLISNQSNVKRWNRGKNSIIQKDPKLKIAIKRIRIKIEKINKLEDN